MFSDCTVLHDSKETEFGNSNQEASQSTGKNTGVVLVSWLLMEVRPRSYFWRSLDAFVMADEFSVTATKVTSKVCYELQPTFLFLTFLSLMNYGHIIKNI